MTVTLTRSPRWKPVPESQSVLKTCPRCKNTGNFILVTDSSGFGLPGTPLLIPYSRVYALHCPICVHVEEISKEEAKMLAKS